MVWPSAGVDVKQCFTVYKCAFLLNSLSNIAFGHLWIPGQKLILTLLIIVSAFGFIRFWDEQDIITLLNGVVLTTACICVVTLSAMLMSKVYSYSSQFKHNMYCRIHTVEYTGMTGLYKRKLRACQVIRCQVGGFYHMEAKAKLKLCFILVKGIVFLLFQHNSQTV